MQLQLKHLSFVFVAVAALCLTGAITASMGTPEPAPTAPLDR